MNKYCSFFWKRIQLVSLLTMSGTILFAQTAITQVINSSGGSYERNGYQVYWSVGELALVNSMNSKDSNLIVSNGFIQPDLPAARLITLPVSRQKPVVSNLEYRISVYPNPAHDFVKIDFLQNYIGNVAMELTDNSGKVLLVKNLQSYGFGIYEKINLAQYAQGSYLLRLSKVQTGEKVNDPETFTYKIIKI